MESGWRMYGCDESNVKRIGKLIWLNIRLNIRFINRNFWRNNDWQFFCDHL